MAAQLNNIRLKLEEKRRRIEQDKRRMEMQVNRQRQQLGQQAFLQAVTRVSLFVFGLSELFGILVFYKVLEHLTSHSHTVVRGNDKRSFQLAVDKGYTRDFVEFYI